MERRNLIAIGGLVAAAAIVIAIVVSFVIATTPPAAAPKVTPGDVSLTGTMTCLPHKGDGPTTLECAIGLKADDGKHYGLRELPREAASETGVRVKITGMLSAPEEKEIYDIAGNVLVESYTKEP